MRKLLFASAAATALLATSLPSQAQSIFSRNNAESQALVVDSRGVLTMAPLLERVTPAVVSIETSSKPKRSTRSNQTQRDMLERFFGQLPPGLDSPDNSDDDAPRR